jgi:hypothetical protein
MPRQTASFDATYGAPLYDLHAQYFIRLPVIKYQVDANTTQFAFIISDLPAGELFSPLLSLSVISQKKMAPYKAYLFYEEKLDIAREEFAPAKILICNLDSGHFCSNKNYIARRAAQSFLKS